jgi:hypothetical protein
MTVVELLDQLLVVGGLTATVERSRDHDGMHVVIRDPAADSNDPTDAVAAVAVRRDGTVSHSFGIPDAKPTALARFRADVPTVDDWTDDPPLDRTLRTTSK